MSEMILFKKITIMHVKGKIFKIKRTICNVLIKSAEVLIVSQKPADSNGLIVVRLKRDLR